MDDVKTDYQPGDTPVPVGTVVAYEGRRYTVEEHGDPENHPWPPPGTDFTVAYPDGTAYVLWPVGVARKFGNRHLSRVWVRRTSFSLT